VRQSGNDRWNEDEKPGSSLEPGPSLAKHADVVVDVFEHIDHHHRIEGHRVTELLERSCDGESVTGEPLTQTFVQLHAGDVEAGGRNPASQPPGTADTERTGPDRESTAHNRSATE
jgi:hypothetical protein